MENLLNVAFDNLSHSSVVKNGKGLRQIEGLLAQICFSSSLSSSQYSSSAPATNGASLKPLDELADDLVFREFFRLQEGFEWNVATRLVECLERLLSMGKSSLESDTLILSALTLLQGILLLHPPSRKLFGRERNMTLILDLLTPTFSASIVLSTLHILVCALLDTPHNTRLFERCDGVATVTALFKGSNKAVPNGAAHTSHGLKLKVVEFFYFYLMPEEPLASTTAPDKNGGSGRSATALRDPLVLSSSTHSSLPSSENKDPRNRATNIRTMTEKQAMLSKYLGQAEVQGLVQDLQESLTGITGSGDTQ